MTHLKRGTLWIEEQALSGRGECGETRDTSGSGSRGKLPHKTITSLKQSEMRTRVTFVFVLGHNFHYQQKVLNRSCFVTPLSSQLSWSILKLDGGKMDKVLWILPYMYKKPASANKLI